MEAFGDPSERAWVAGKAIVMFEGRHQFEELPVLRRRGKQKEKGYRHKVFLFLGLTYVTWHNVLSVHPCCFKISFSFVAESYSMYMCI